MELITERLVLREYIKDDWQAVLDYQSTPQYQRYYPWAEPSPQSVRSFIGEFIDWQNDQPRHNYQLAVLLKGGGQLIGSCGVRRGKPHSWEAELGYELAPAYWGKGFATEAANVMLTFAFQRLQLHRVLSTCIAENLVSLRVLEKIGMRREGCLRENVWMEGRWWDSLVYGLLVYEWDALDRHVLEVYE